MPKFISKEKQREAIQSLPPGADPKILLQKMVDRGYELEGINAKFSFFEHVTNVPGSLLEYGKNFVQAMIHPIQTADALTDMTLGAAIKYTGGTEQFTGDRKEAAERMTDSFDGLSFFFQQRLGSKEKVLNTIEKDPVGFLSDLSSIAGGVSMAAKGVGLAGKFTRFTSAAAKITKAGKLATQLSKNLEPITAIRNTAKVVNKYSGLHKLFRTSMRRGYKKILQLEKGEEAALATATGIKGSAIDWLGDHGIYGSFESMSNQLETIAAKTYNAVDDVLLTDARMYQHPSFRRIVGEAKDALKPLKKGRMSEEFAGYSRTLSDLDVQMKNVSIMPPEGMTLFQANQLRRIADKVLSIYKKSSEIKEGVIAANMEKSLNSLRRFISEKAPATRKLNQQIQMAKGWKKIIDKAATLTPVPPSEIRTFISASVVGGAIVSGNTTFIATGIGWVAMERLMMIPEIRTFFATRLRLLSQGEYKELLAGAQTGNWTREARRTATKLRRDFQALMPQLRMLGIIKEQSGASGEY